MKKNKPQIGRVFCLMGLFILIFSQSQAAIDVSAAAPAAAMNSGSPESTCGAGQPVLISPTNLEALSALYTAFTFQTVAGVAKYKVEVATEDTFSEVEPDKSERGYKFTISDPSVASYTLDSSLAQNFLPATLYYWRVTPMCGEILGTASQIFSFTTPESAPLLPAPELGLPADESYTLSSAVTFTWNQVPGASSYQIRFYAYPSNAASDTSFLLKADGVWLNIHHLIAQVPEFPADTTIYWRVSAVDSYAVGELSEVYEFTTPVKVNEQIISQAGGTLTTTSGVEINFGPGVLPGATEIHYESNSHPSNNNLPFRLANRSFSITATRLSDGQAVTQFTPYLTLTIHMTQEDLDFVRILENSRLFLYFWNGTTWERIKHEYVDYDHGLIIFRVTHLTEFALGSPETVFIPFICR